MYLHPHDAISWKGLSLLPSNTIWFPFVTFCYGSSMRRYRNTLDIKEMNYLIFLKFLSILCSSSYWYTFFSNCHQMKSEAYSFWCKNLITEKLVGAFSPFLPPFLHLSLSSGFEEWSLFLVRILSHPNHLIHQYWWIHQYWLNFLFSTFYLESRQFSLLTQLQF